MKKALLCAVLSLAGTVSWSFYPKTAEPTGYMLVIGSSRGAGFGGLKSTLTTVSPTGEQQIQELESKALTSKNAANNAVELHSAELLKLNQLKTQGWRIISVTQSNTFQGAVNETTYLLDKN